jgi:hypothetical protein
MIMSDASSDDISFDRSIKFKKEFSTFGVLYNLK